MLSKWNHSDCWNKLELVAGTVARAKWELNRQIINDMEWRKSILHTCFVFSHRQIKIEFAVLFTGSRNILWIQLGSKRLYNIYTRQWITRNGQQLGLMRALRMYVQNICTVFHPSSLGIRTPVRHVTHPFLLMGKIVTKCEDKKKFIRTLYWVLLFSEHLPAIAIKVNSCVGDAIICLLLFSWIVLGLTMFGQSQRATKSPEYFEGFLNIRN